MGGHPSRGTVTYSLAVRALHVKILHSLSAHSMINVMTRFISMRGCPKEIRSDNGTNFTGAVKELTNAVEQWHHHKISNFCA